MDKSEKQYRRDELKYLQSMPLSIKIGMTKNRIREWLREYDAYVSFSGGKDSTVLLDIARQVDPNLPAVFIDTGLEYPELRDFVKTVGNVTWLKPEMNFRRVIETYGYPLISKEVSEKIDIARRNPTGSVAQHFVPGNAKDAKYDGFSVVKWKFLLDSNIKVSKKCCDIMKKKPAKQYEKETGRRPIVATMACESQLRTTHWLKEGCNAFDAKRPISRPMSFWTEQDVLEYLVCNGLSYASVYGSIIKSDDGIWRTTGAQRTGCIFCGYGCQLEKEPNRFQRLKQTHPQLWDYCMRPTSRGGLGMQEVLDFINVKTE